jgi:hypothetical protein
LIVLGAALVVTAALLYLFHYAVFRDAHHIYIYLLGDLAFLPLEVLLVTIIVDTLLNARDRRAALEKMNMVIGAFFSEVGTELLRDLCRFDPGVEEKRLAFAGFADWKEADFHRVKGELKAMNFKCDSRAADIQHVKDILDSGRNFMVQLLENPMLLEHESFTEMLWAVFHLTEELASRPILVGLPESDMDHLAGDLGRAYGWVVAEWLEYLEHLKRAYPHLFSLAVRLNPFDPVAQATITA